MIRRVRFAILALLIVGVFGAGAALDWSSSIRTAVPAIELRPAPLPELVDRAARPIARTKPTKPSSAARKVRNATPDVRPVSPPAPVVVTRPRVATPTQPEVEDTPRPAAPRVSANRPTKTAQEQKPANNPSANGGQNGQQQQQATAPQTTTATTQTETTGAEPAPASPAPAGDDDDDDDDDEGDDGDDGDDGGDDD
jgi:outer membrane biosynthesis protein TonB